MNASTKMQLRRYGIMAGVVMALLILNRHTARAQRTAEQNELKKIPEKGGPEPTDWEKKDWTAFVTERSPDAPPLAGKIICVGSSHMAQWKSVGHDLRPFTVYNFGIGGTTMQDAARAFAQNLVIPFSPRAVVLYEGSNDIARGTTPEQILHQFRDFYSQIHDVLPETRLYVLGIVPSPGQRFEKWDTIKSANAILEKECKQYSWLSFIDTTSGLIGQDEQPRMECFIPSDIHMNRRGYEVWAAAVRPVVLAVEREHETQNTNGRSSQ